ncbi:8534_t:CDS:2, partial [Funneliformis caledonium]
FIMEKHIIDYLRTNEYRSWSVLSVLQYLSVNIKYTNDNIEEISRILQQQLDVTLQDPNIFKLARDKAKKLSENLALDINKPEVQEFFKRNAQLKVELKWKDEDLKEKDREIKNLKNKLIASKVFISEELSKVNQGMSDWTRLKNALRAEKYKYPKVVTQQLFKVLERLGLTLKEFDNLLELKIETKFPDDWELTKQALIKIMVPLEMWLLLQLAQEPSENQMRELMNPIKRSDYEYFVARKPSKTTSADVKMELFTQNQMVDKEARRYNFASGRERYNGASLPQDELLTDESSR